MGKRLPIKDSVRQKYAEEIARSEQMAQTGFDKSKVGAAKINEDVYGPTQMGAVDPIQEMKVFENEGLADASIRKAFEAEMEKKQPNPNAKMDAAVAAAQAEEAQKAVQEPPVAANEPAAPPVAPAAPAAEEPVETLSEDPEERLAQVAIQLAKQFPGAPSLEQLRQWKSMHGDVFLLPIDDKVYIYRYLKRQEWAQMQANSALQELRPDQQEDMMFNKCLLWPALAPQQMAGLPAGAVSMIVEQIRMQSLFLDPVQVANLTLKL